MRPIAISEQESGEAHVAVLSSPNVARRRVSYFNHLLEAREAHELAYDEPLGAFVWDRLEGLAVKQRERNNR